MLPGQQAGLHSDAPTIRLKALRDGISDYDYEQTLKNLDDGAFADQVAQSVGPDFKNWSRNPDAVEKAHQLLGERIEKDMSQKP